MRHWHHAPLHKLSASGAYIITTGTYLKAHHFRGPERLTLLHDTLLELAELYDWQLQAWAIMSNHYHFMADSPNDAQSLHRLIRHLHSVTAREVNRLDATPGRKVWHNFWETHLTFHESYLARLNYVHRNPVKHRLVTVPEQYQWCSAAWFAQTADPSFQRTVSTFRTDELDAKEDF